MSSPFVAEIRMFAGNFAPTGWAECNGQILPISQNTALFSLLGTVYGGDGKSTFALPDLQGSVPVHQGQGPGLSEYFLGQASGSESTTLIQTEMPAHSHDLTTSNTDATERQPPGQRLAKGAGIEMYNANTQPTTNMNFQALTVAGGSLPHNNMMRYLAVTFAIALQGVFPPRS
jgi:microcystin-dependent protein